MKTNGANVTTFTPTNPVDLSGIKHPRFWMLSTHGGDFSQIELGISDGGNTGYWVVATSTEYPGGWYSCMIDVSKTVDSGTKPSNMNAITEFIFRVTLTGGKNATNFWLDNLIYCDGLIAYGDLAGSPFTLDDVYTTGISEATGILEKFGGTIFSTGSLVIGDTGTNIVDFQSINELLIFKDKSAYLNAALYSITCVGNSTGATQDVFFGEKAGATGINGALIKCNIASMAFDFTALDTDLHNFGVYGTTFDTYGLIDLMPNAATYEALNCSFVNGQGQIQPNTMTFTGHFVIGGISTDGSVLYESTSHNISYITYVDNSRATEFTTADTYNMIGDKFIGGTYDVHFSASTGNLIINLGGSPKADANPGQVENDSTGTVTLNNTVDITINVKTLTGTNIENARVFLIVESGGDYPFEASVTIASTGTLATVIHNSHGLKTDEIVKIKGANEWHYNGVFVITVTGVNNYTYTMVGDPVDTATGTITSTTVLMQELTNGSGLAVQTVRYITTDINFNGWARKSTSTPFYKTGIISGSIGNADYNNTILLALDE